MTSTPHSPANAANVTFSTPTISSVCQRSSPKRMPAILHGRQIHGGHDHAVEEEAEVERAEAAHGRRRRARVAHLVELEIGQDARPAPQPRVEEHRRDAGQHERPPDPVAGDAVAPDDVGHQVRRVRAERRRHHREPGEPPRHGAARREELGRALAGAPAEEQRRAEADEERREDDDPVEELSRMDTPEYTLD